MLSPPFYTRTEEEDLHFRAPGFGWRGEEDDEDDEEKEEVLVVVVAGRLE